MMKPLVFAAFFAAFFGIVPGSHAAPELPTVDPCEYSGKCSKPMQDMWNELQAAGGVHADLVPSVYSGECYYLGAGFDPAQVQWGYAFLDRKAESPDIYVGGRYCFFCSGNPYKSLTIETARQQNSDIYDSNQKLSLANDFAFIDLNPNATTPGGVLITWFRESANGDRLYSFGTWGSETLRFCRFQRH